MKILIYFLCYLVLAILEGILMASAHITLGAIPQVVLFLITGWIAQSLVKRWEQNHPKQ